jgi:hypothetical protein
MEAVVASSTYPVEFAGSDVVWVIVRVVPNGWHVGVGLFRRVVQQFSREVVESVVLGHSQLQLLVLRSKGDVLEAEPCVIFAQVSDGFLGVLLGSRLSSW